jgi:hypothetical protein
MIYSQSLRLVKLPSFPNSASAEMSTSLELSELGMKWNVLQIEIKRGEVTQFPQFRECGDVRELIKFITRNGEKRDTD